ncbi:MAG: DUF1311 domain-containing protein [Shewanella sp.]|nr:DUF1311 domain-containing protein [Shewanella sp.]
MAQCKKTLLILLLVPFICSANKVAESIIEDETSLNTTYRNTLNQLNEGQKTKIIKAQLSWIEYRGAICKFESDLPNNGHLIEGEVSNLKLRKCLSRLNITRTKELKEYYNLVTETKSYECIEYTDIKLLQDQVEIEGRVKGIFTLLIKNSEKHEYGSVTLHTKMESGDNGDLEIMLLANVVPEFTKVYGASPDVYLIGKTVRLKSSARRVEKLKFNYDPSSYGGQSKTNVTMVTISSLSKLIILK